MSKITEYSKRMFSVDHKQERTRGEKSDPAIHEKNFDNALLRDMVVPE